MREVVTDVVASGIAYGVDEVKREEADAKGKSRNEPKLVKRAVSRTKRVSRYICRLSLFPDILCTRKESGGRGNRG